MGLYSVKIVCYNKIMNKKILIASDSFKGSLSSTDISDAFIAAAGDGNFPFDISGIAVADGGEGTLDAILASGRYIKRCVECLNPLFNKISASYAVLEDTAVVEMAQSSGLTLIEPKKGNVAITTSYGTGEVIAAAIKDGAKKVYVCVGGSATNDGGIGALTALGYEFLDASGNRLAPIGKNLAKIADVRKTSNLCDGVELTIIADVDNPLIGSSGATLFYGRQKGADDRELEQLESGMTSFADITQGLTGVSLHNMRGAGAAGGLAGGLIAYLKADIRSGIESVLDLVDFEKQAQNCDIIITGEGKLDIQSLHGKAVCGVCVAAKRLGKPVYVISGCSELNEQEREAMGIKHIQTILEEAESIEDSICHAKEYVYSAAKKLLQIIKERENG